MIFLEKKHNQAYQSSLFSERRLVQRNLSEMISNTAEKLQHEKEELELRLETEMDLLKRARIKGKIDELNKEIRELQQTDTPASSLLSFSLQNHLNEIDEELNKVSRVNKRQKLTDRKREALKALETRQAPINSPEQLKEAIDTLHSDERLLEKLRDGTVDQVDIDYLMTSDLSPLFDQAMQGRLSIAFEQIHTTDLVRTALRPPLPVFQEKIDQQWKAYKAGLNEELDRLREERRVLSETEGSQSLIEDLDNQIELTEKQLKEGYNHFCLNTKVELDQKVNGNVTEPVDTLTLNHLRDIIREAQSIRTEKIQEYLKGRFSGLQQKFDTAKEEGVFSDSMTRRISETIEKAKTYLIDRPSRKPEEMMIIAQNIESARQQLDGSVGELKDLNRNRPKIEKKLQADFTRVQSFVQKMTPHRIAEIRQALSGVNIPGKQKSLAVLEALSDPKSDLKEQIEEIGRNVTNCESMPAEEIQLFKQELETLLERIEFFEDIDEKIRLLKDKDYQTAAKAHEIVAALPAVKSAIELVTALELKLGKEHVRLAEGAEFEQKYREYTKTGNMVFREQGDSWEIILNKKTLQKEGGLEQLKKEITHELLHLEFEKGKGVKEAARKRLIEENPEQWGKIRDAFLRRMEETSKTPPNGESWTDDDILSELYAMQNEFSATGSTDSEPLRELNNLLIGSGLGAALKGVTSKIDEYEKNAEPDPELIRGYEEGMGGAGSEAVEGAEGSGASYSKNEELIKDLSRRIKELQSSEYIDHTPDGRRLLRAMNDYNSGTSTLNSYLNVKDPDDVIATDVKSRIDQLGSDLKKVEEEMAKAGDKISNKVINPLQSLWNRTVFLTPSDFVKLGTDIGEFMQRRYKRREADHSARLGMSLFHGTALGSEMGARQQKAEAEEVQEWQSRYEYLDAWELQNELVSLSKAMFPSKDQLKAILRILAKKGRVDWQNKELWQILNRLQSATHLTPGDQVLLHNPILLRQKLQTAMGEIWDYDEFTTLERDNESAYDSEKKKYDPSNERMQDQLTGRLDYLLKKFVAGERVDPIMYESILEYCIINGKSYAEHIMFHLITAMARGLLTPDRGLGLSKHLNEWPSIEFFGAMKPHPSQKDFEKMCKDNFPDDFEKGTTGNQFMNFYWTEIQNTPQVVDRVIKSVKDRKWDHDWSRAIACLGDAKTAKKFLSGRSGQEEAMSTAIANSYVGIVQFLEENASNPEAHNRDRFAKIAGYIAMSEGNLDRTAYFRGDSDITSREDEALNTRVPREAPVGNHGDWSLRQHRNKSTYYLDLIDPQFFSSLRKKVAHTKEDKQQLGEMARDILKAHYPGEADWDNMITNVDDVYDNMDLIVKIMFKEKYMSQARFKGILAAVAV
jgi:hypothetical protein